MQNVHDGDLHRPVTALVTKVRRRAAGFPGWGAVNYAEFLLPISEGLRGAVTSVESHGSAPFTRYGVRFEDGSAASGLELGRDIRFGF
jgi:hypothetical protein